MFAARGTLLEWCWGGVPDTLHSFPYQEGFTRLPYFQFYPGDWLKDANLRRCTPNARAFWIDLICVMFECHERGILSTGGEPWTDEEIARAVPGDTFQNLLALQELLKNQIVRRNEAGAVYSKRLMADQEERDKWRNRQLKHRDTKRHANVTPVVTPMSRPSSSSSSILNSNTEREEPALVDWIPLNLWRDYLSMREKLKHPLTAAGIDIQIGKLRALRDAGEDVVQVLEQAISGSWFDFKAIRKERANGAGESFHEKRSRTSAAAIQKVFGRDEELAGPIRRALPPTRQ